MSQEEKYKRGQYGYTLLSKVVNAYMDESFNDGRKYYTNLLKMAKVSFYELFTKKFRLSKNMVIHIDPSTNTGLLPSDFGGLPSFFVVDECNRKQPLSTDENYNVVPITERPSNKGCGCRKCNCDNEACGAVNSPTYLSETITVAPGVTGEKITQTKALPNGDLIEEITMPIAQGDGTGAYEIVSRTTRRYIAKLDLKPCGCVLNLPKNNQKVIDACGCHVPCLPNASGPVPSVANSNGKFVVDADQGIVHFIGVKQKYAVMNYIGSGECETDEIMVPDWAVEYMKADIHFRSMRFRNIIPGSVKRDAERFVEIEYDKLVVFLNPIDWNELTELKSGHFYKW
jgi:hypothetical protein